MHEICLLIGEFAIRININALLGIENNLLLEQLLLSEQYRHCTGYEKFFNYPDDVFIT